MLKILKTMAASALSLLTGLCALMTMASCSGVFEDLEECPRGVIMRFVFDYNLEFANAFPNQVDCLSVYIFNNEGQLVRRVVETSEALADEDWRLTLDLPAGDYRAVAYGGLECDQASFAHTRDTADIRTLQDLEVLINSDHIGDEAYRPDRPLHDLYHGAQDFTVTEGTDYDSTTVKMMRNTNHIRLVLQHIDNSPVNDSDFRFEIVDDNTLFNHANEVISNGTVTYTPWATGTATTGTDALETTDRASASPVQVAYAELSVSRLMLRSALSWTDTDGDPQRGPRLHITNVTDGHVVVDLPLNNYLLMLKSEALAQMPDQEFLDRASRYSLFFFLDYNNAWVRVTIQVGDWTVRLNNIKF